LLLVKVFLAVDNGFGTLLIFFATLLKGEIELEIIVTQGTELVFTLVHEFEIFENVFVGRMVKEYCENFSTIFSTDFGAII